MAESASGQAISVPRAGAVAPNVGTVSRPVDEVHTSGDLVGQILVRATREGAKILLTGDTEQLSAPEAAGAYRK